MKQILSILFVLWLGVTSLTAQKKQRSFTKEFYFVSASFELDSNQLVIAKKFKKQIGRFNLTRITITGFTDNDGSESSNLKLSKKRIKTIQEFLTDSSIDIQFNSNPKGEKEPEFDNEGDNKYKNRRVKVVAFYNGKKIILSEEVKESIIVAENQIKKDFNNLEIGKVIYLPPVKFHGGSTDFLPGAKELLMKVVPILKANPTVKVELAGHVCCLSDMKLSKDRAEKVYNFLIKNGINADNLTYKGYNNKKPKFGNLMDIRNRRVEMRVLKI